MFFKHHVNYFVKARTNIFGNQQGINLCHNCSQCPLCQLFQELAPPRASRSRQRKNCSIVDSILGKGHRAEVDQVDAREKVQLNAAPFRQDFDLIDFSDDRNLFPK